MSMLGELFGYDAADNDLLGANRDPNVNCVAHGLSTQAHSVLMMHACLRAIFGTKETTK